MPWEESQILYVYIAFPGIKTPWGHTASGLARRELFTDTSGALQAFDFCTWRLWAEMMVRRYNTHTQDTHKTVHPPRDAHCRSYLSEDGVHNGQQVDRLPLPRFLLPPLRPLHHLLQRLLQRPLVLGNLWALAGSVMAIRLRCSHLNVPTPRPQLVGPLPLLLHLLLNGRLHLEEQRRIIAF